MIILDSQYKIDLLILYYIFSQENQFEFIDLISLI